MRLYNFDKKDLESFLLTYNISFDTFIEKVENEGFFSVDVGVSLAFEKFDKSEFFAILLFAIEQFDLNISICLEDGYVEVIK